MFTAETVFCNGCGKPFETTFHVYGGHVCGDVCFNIIEQKKTKSMLENISTTNLELAEQVVNMKTDERCHEEWSDDLTEGFSGIKVK